MRFGLIVLSVPSVPKDPNKGDSSDSLGRGARVLATQRQEKLSVNNKQLFIETQWCNNYIYNIYMEIGLILYLRDKRMRHLAGVVFL